jgi:flavin-dependent dehydrogenase
MLLPRLRASARGGQAELHGRLLELLPGVEAERLVSHHLPLSTWRPPPAHGAVLLVGDALSLINPLTGEGIYYALLSGRLAGAPRCGAPRRAPAYARRCGGRSRATCGTPRCWPG